MSLGFSRRAQVGMASGLAAVYLAQAASPALAGGVRSQEWWLQKIHVTRAWQSTHAGGVTVALLDTGVDPNQADLSGAVITGPDYSHSSRLPGGPFWGVHGTAMASLIAGHGHGAHEGAGIMGVAPTATILSLRVTLESNDPLLADATIAAGLPAAIANGIRYAVKHGAQVIDLPLDPVTTPGHPGAGGSSAERAAVAYATARHVVLVAPAGDDTASGAGPVNFPASYRGVISVGAFDASFTKASFSSHQPYVTLTAPGVGMVAASPSSGYTQVSSTSAASAIVAGIAALIRARFPALGPAQVARALKDSTVYRPPGGQSDGSGAGTVDAARALAAAARMAEVVPASGPSAGSGTAATQAPSALSAVHSGRNLMGTLRTDAGIAVVIFFVLVLPILGYTSLRRRRARAARLAKVRASAQVPARGTGQTAAAGAGQHVYSAAPVGPAPVGPATVGPATVSPGLPGTMPATGTGAGTASNTRASGESTFPGSAFPRSAFPGVTPFPDAEPGRGAAPVRGAPPFTDAPPVPDTPPVRAAAPFPGAAHGAEPDSTAGPIAGPAEPGGPAGSITASHRMGVTRAPRVSGSPPWEPAQRPAGEVPLSRPAPVAAGPAVPAPTGLPIPIPAAPEPPAPDISRWDAIAEEAWPGGPGAAARLHAPGPQPRGPATNGVRGAARESGSGQDEDGGPARPIYVWNPSAQAGNVPPAPSD